MIRFSIPLGRFFGVDVRLHVSFVLLLALATGFSAVVTGSTMRGFGLWLALCAAIVVREVARGVTTAYLGMDLRALLLFPMGGIMALTPSRTEPKLTAVAVAGPVANVFCGLLMLGTSYAFLSGLQLFAQPWLSFAHILRSFVWMQFVIAIVGLLPSALPNRKLFGKRETAPAAAVPAGSMPPFHLGSMVALAVALAGLATLNPWLIALGGLFFLGAQINLSQQPANTQEASSIRVREVMLTDLILLSSSDTLGDVLTRTVHTMQEVFPVVRGDRLVGSVSRGTVVEHMRVNGDGYLQGVMMRSLHSASPDESLSEALQRSAALGASEFLPVVEEDGRLMGILTPQSLTRAVQLVKAQAAPATNSGQA
ncbi:MAG: CBS domain-containing protein [Acidobacteriaceae bacterium]|nr:CBS domain-containing protein [Acidobacteriaceae bacterium]